MPGRIVYGALPVDAAYWVLHGLTFSGGVAALFFLVRRHLGIAAAVVGAATLALTPMYWNAQYWDYIDGVTLTYLLAGLCFGLPLATGPPARRLAGCRRLLLRCGGDNEPVRRRSSRSSIPSRTSSSNRRRVCGSRFVMALKDVAAFLVGAAALLIAPGPSCPGQRRPVHLLPAPNRRNPFGHRRLVQDRQDMNGFARSRACSSRSSCSSSPLPFLLLDAVCRRFDSRQEPSRGWLISLPSSTAGNSSPAAACSSTPTTSATSQISIALTMASVAALAISLVRSRWPANAGVAAAATIAAVVALGLIYQRRAG